MQIINESGLINAIIRALYPYCKLERHNVGCFYTKDGRHIDMGTPKGFPDLSGHRKSDGRAVYIECKYGNNNATPEQVKYLREAKETGVLAGICRSVDEALRLIEK